MKYLLPTGFILALCAIAWITGPLIPQSATPALFWVLLGMFPGVLIALIAIKLGGRKPVIPSEFSRPLQEFNQSVGTPHSRKR